MHSLVMVWYLSIQTGDDSKSISVIANTESRHVDYVNQYGEIALISFFLLFFHSSGTLLGYLYVTLNTILQLMLQTASSDPSQEV